MNIECNDVQRERLITLVKDVFPIMLNKPVIERFLHHYAHSCGTPMCIAGYACMLPKFNIQGIIMVQPYLHGIYEPSFNKYRGARALNAFFGRGSYSQIFASNTSGGDLSDYYITIKRCMDLENFLGI